ncbi:Phage integrase family protein [Paracoccus haematequi]|uniref:Phage integrase family protein n=1 Tax=Paracoccus haematequi TaxID=2491866 RepID=A0A3S5D465_9RHOB|nr:tyrosine-type recombinase/integrase [Paracoccus haematequi]VDS09661.1 Phage integrase family protein [Paracoccus haematequi]
MDLTKKAIDALPYPGTGQAFYWFDSPKGFGLRVTPTAKTFIYEGRVRGTNAKRRVSLGAVDRYSDLKKARADATKVSGKMNDGIDPSAEKVRQKAEAITLQEAMTRYIDAPKKKGAGYGSGIKTKKARTKRDIETVMNRHFSDWMKKPAAGITGEMVAKRQREIAETAPTQANLAMRYLRATLNHVNPRNAPIFSVNPVEKLREDGLWADTKRKTGRIKRDSLPEWVQAVETGLVGLKYEHEHRDALLFLLLTGARLAEVFGNEKDGYPPLRWRDVDFNARTITFRDTKNRTDHELPMGERLTEILNARKEVAGKEFVFSRSNGEIVTDDLRSAFARIEKVTGIRATAHDLRRTFASVAESQDISIFKLKRLLNHISGDKNDVTVGYVGDISTDDLREPMQRIEDFMLRPVVAEQAA